MSPADRPPDLPIGEDIDEPPSENEAIGNSEDISANPLQFERVDPRVPKRSRFTGVPLFITIALIVAGIGLWVAWEGYWGKSDLNEIPLIKAAEGPYKIKPKMPGGMPIPDDMRVYDRLEKNPQENVAERLLPPPEEPKTPPKTKLTRTEELERKNRLISPNKVEEILNKNGTQTPIEKSKILKLNQSKELLSDTDSSLSPLNGGRIIEKTPTKKSTPVRGPKLANEELTPGSDKIVPTNPSADRSSKTSYQIQLAAVRDDLAAKAEWRRLLKKNRLLLGGLQPNIVRVDLGSKGIYFRVRAGSFTNRELAQRLCQDLVKNKVSCLVVKIGS